MATFLEGTRGSGKSKYAVQKIQRYLNENRRVCTNLDLFLEHLQPENNKSHYIRLPDFPRSIDLLSVGKAYDSLDHDDPDTYDENKNGLIVIDELLTSFNSRNWNDPDRLEVINWIVQSRKFGWDLYLIGQDFGSIDKQIQDTVIDEIIVCRSSEKLFPGFFFKVFLKPIVNKLFGKFHIAKIYDGKTKADSNLNGTEHFTRNDLHICYKTGQKFTKAVRLEPSSNGRKMIEIDERAFYSAIGSHYFNERIEVKKEIVIKENISFYKKPVFAYSFSLIFFLFSVFLITDNSSAAASSSPVVIKSSNVVKSFSFSDSKQSLSDSDLGQIFINCLEYWQDGRFTYCFNNIDGRVIHPENVGYEVLYQGQCHAKLRRQKVLLDVFCDPKEFSWTDEPPVQDNAVPSDISF